MQEVLAGLKSKAILNHHDITNIKEAIGKRFIDAEKKRVILTKSVFQLVDNYIPKFQEQHREQIRHSIIKKAIAKQTFSVDAGDVLHACLTEATSIDYNDHYVDLLTEWLNKHQTTTVLRESVTIILARVCHYPAELLSNFQLEALLLTPKSTLPQTINNSEYYLMRIKLLIQNTLHRLSLSNLIRIPRTPIILLTLASILTFSILLASYLEPVFVQSVSSQTAEGLPSTKPDNQLPPQLKFKQVNESALKKYLARKNSLLAQEKYFRSIIQAAEEFNVNPLLLFAITGQEQAFVPNHNINSTLIVNNPFNVFHSWKDYNTNIRDSARIAARTIVNLSNNRPNAVEPIAWINRKYAEDKNWSRGVGLILKDLEEKAQ